MATLLVALGLACTTAVEAETYGDLIVGFTTQSGTDKIYDIGGLASLVNGQTWSATTLGITGGTFNWGVIGDASAAAQSTSYDSVWTTVAAANVSQVVNLNGSISWGSLNTGINTVADNLPGAPGFMPNSGASITATAATSWNEETINGTLASDYHSAYLNPNVVNQATASLYQVNDNNTAPTLVGTFTLSTSGILTFNAASAAPTASFSGTPTTGSAPLQVVFANASASTITNSLWTFGDGNSATNTGLTSVTNTYAAAGTYTVSLKVTGPGGNNTQTRTGYIVVSPASAPRFNLETLSSGKLIISGTNGSATAQFRILCSTNLSSGTWTPIYTNQFTGSGTFSYTNSSVTNPAVFFKLITP